MLTVVKVRITVSLYMYMCLFFKIPVWSRFWMPLLFLISFIFTPVPITEWNVNVYYQKKSKNWSNLITKGSAIMILNSNIEYYKNTDVLMYDTSYFQVTFRHILHQGHVMNWDQRLSSSVYVIKLNNC